MIAQNGVTKNMAENEPLPENDLEDGMRSGRVHVGRRDTGSPDVVSMLDQPEHILDAADLFLFESYHLDLLLGILENSQLLLVIQQVKHLRQETNKSRHGLLYMIVYVCMYYMLVRLSGSSSSSSTNFIATHVLHKTSGPDVLTI